MIKNSTFLGAEPTWANACVGNNGQPDYVEYSKGFSAAANILLEHVLYGDGRFAVDDLIYPICFNMRHSVELRLKGAIEEIVKISAAKRCKISFNLSGSHDIGNIWSFFKIESEKIDKRYNPINKKMQGIIADIASIDSTGQTFRYPADNESNKHLTDVGLINCRILLEKFKLLEEHLNELHNLNKYLVKEYSLGTFTNTLSRCEIFEIAKKLPNRDSWKEDHFHETKQAIKKEHELSSRELSRALEIIQSNYETAALISAPKCLLGITEEQITELIEHWSKLHPDFKNREPQIFIPSSHSEDMLEGMMRDREIEKEILAALNDKITPEYIAGINTLFYFARDLDFSENYEKTYQCELTTALALSNNRQKIEESLEHIISKTNMLDNFLTSLYFLCFTSLAEQIVNSYQLNGVISYLPDLRSRAMFRKHDSFGY